MIDFDLGRWNMEALKANFDASEVVHIANIRLSTRFPDDKLIWHFEKDVEYYIKTTYHLLGNLNNRSRHGLSTRLDLAVWKSLWKAHVHECVKFFTWRLSKYTLPTK